jgi:hypothetical protein
MRQYARGVDKALRPLLAGLGVPLILAAAEPLDSIYRSASSITGNPETRSDAELAAAARTVPDELNAAASDGRRRAERGRRR